jgi:hypothetical protein
MKRLLCMAAVLLVTACVEEPPTRSGGKPLGEVERAQCLMQGGTIGQGGLSPDEVCILPQADAGKACTKQSDCSGMCLADTMTCSTVKPMFGCFEFLDETGQKVGICID